MFNKKRKESVGSIINIMNEMTGNEFNENKSMLLNALKDLDDTNSVQEIVRILERSLELSVSNSNEFIYERKDIESSYNDFCRENNDKYKEKLDKLKNEELEKIGLEVLYEMTVLVRNIGFYYRNTFKKSYLSNNHGELLVNIISKLSDDVHNIPLCILREEYVHVKNNTLKNEITYFLNTVTFFKEELDKIGSSASISVKKIEDLIDKEGE